MQKTLEQTKNKVYLVVSVAALLLAAVSIATIVSATEGSNDDPVSKRAHPLRQAVADNNFEEFQSILIDKGKDPEKISEENFNKLVEAHNLRLAGDTQGAREIFKELHTQHEGEFDGQKHKRFHRKHHQRHKHHQPES